MQALAVRSGFAGRSQGHGLQEQVEDKGQLKLISVVSDKRVFKYIISKRRSKENIGDGHLIGIKKKPRHSMYFLRQSSLILIRPWAARPLTQRISSVGTAPFHCGHQHCEGAAAAAASSRVHGAGCPAGR